MQAPLDAQVRMPAKPGKAVRTAITMRSSKVVAPILDACAQVNREVPASQAIIGRFNHSHCRRHTLSAWAHLPFKIPQQRCVLVEVFLLAACLQPQGQSAPKPAPSSTWVTSSFSVGLDENGLIISLRNPADPAAMNWVSEIGPDWVALFRVSEAS